ncbi:FecR family protein [Treponema primitia]|uniref:FecR family protein n=1 Tax=Treponema primitia TaxID=88058 RepID=UPI00397FE225
MMGRISFFVLFIISAGLLFSQESGFFRELSGTVEMQVSGSSVWVKAAQGDRIEKGTRISTGFKSTALIALGDSVITVRPLTRLSLEEILRNDGDEQVNIYLHAGRIRADVSPPSGGKTNFTVRSPTVTASVRGTSFEFDTVNLRVDEGRVQYVHANGSLVNVSKRETSYVDETDRRVVSPFEAAAASLTPALPFGNTSGLPSGDTAPIIDMGTVPTGDVGLGGFDWD